MACPECGKKWLSYSMSAVIGYSKDFTQASCPCGWKSEYTNGTHKIVQSKPAHPTMPGASYVKVVPVNPKSEEVR